MCERAASKASPAHVVYEFEEPPWETLMVAAGTTGSK
jgi:hypothetical protein